MTVELGSNQGELKMQELSEALGKIRHHTSSKIPNQKAPAQLLVALEATFDAEDGRVRKERSPIEYLMALLSLLKKATEESASIDTGANSTLLPSSMYLLTLVTPYVAPGVLRSQLSNLVEVLSFVLSSSYPSSSSASPAADSYAAPLKSAMAVLQELLLALAIDRATLSSNLQLRGCYNSTLRFCMDARPKVRRKAQEVIQEVLDLESDNVKPHPYAAKTAEWAITALEQVNISGSIAGHVKAPSYDRKTGRATQPEVAAAERQKRADSGSANTGIWICAFLRQLVSIIPVKSIPHLSTNLLRLISQKNPFLSTAAFEVFESLFQLTRPNENSTITASSLSSLSSSETTSKKINTDSTAQILDALCSSTVEPSSKDVQLVPAYLRALENAMVAYSRVEEGRPAWHRVPSVWKIITNLALSTKSKASRDAPLVRAAGGHALSALIRYCIPNCAIDEALAAKKKGEKNSLLVIVSFFEDSLDAQALHYSHTRPMILSALATLVTRFKYGPQKEANGRCQPVANDLLINLIAAVGTLRIQPNFEFREQADAVIGAAIEVCGPSAVLNVLPLNLLGEEGVTGGRAWLLPLMKSRITNTQLAYFVSTMVPLSESIYNKRAEAEENDTATGKPKAPIQAKVYEALIEQIWGLFPGFCNLPTDLRYTLKGDFVDLLGNVLYSQNTLRPSICRGLQLLVERNLSLSVSAADSTILRSNFGLDAKDGLSNIQHLSTLGPSLLAILFNVYSQSAGESRGYLANCMTALINIVPKSEISSLYTKISTILQESLPSLVPAKERDAGPGSTPPIPHTMIDLLSLLVSNLDITKEGRSLFELACSDNLLACRDAGLQKKTYRLLSKLIEGNRGPQILRLGQGQGNHKVLNEFLKKLDATSGNVVSGAKRDRTALLASLIPLIPQSELHLLPSIIPEAILATKEINQGARELAYSLLVEMGNKMDKGGQIKRHLVDRQKADNEEEMISGDDEKKIKEEVVNANLNEYVTMVAAGLAGSTPHMISATITALARLVYEFHTRLPMTTLKELVSTLEVFMASPNREIVKSNLGFVKVVIVSLPGNTMEDSLPTLVSSLLSKENHHRQHFKAKIRHIFERLLRRFGYEKIESMTDEENRKLLVNIRKRKERAKRKKATAQNEIDNIDEDEISNGGVMAGQRTIKTYGADAFEEAIYGSESDLSASEDEGDADDEKAFVSGQKFRLQQQHSKNIDKAKRSGNREGQEYILQDDDAPMDLLDRSVAAGVRVIASGSKKMGKNRKRQPGQEARHFELDEATGRMMIDANEKDDETNGADHIDIDGVGRAYLDRERGIHGITSKEGGTIRINKNNKRNRAADEELELEQMMLEEQQQQQQQQQPHDSGKKKTKRVQEKIGSEFKAKKAGGDVKKGQMKPFAYVPLNQIGSKNKKSNIKFLAKDQRRE